MITRRHFFATVAGTVVAARVAPAIAKPRASPLDDILVHVGYGDYLLIGLYEQCDVLRLDDTHSYAQLLTRWDRLYVETTYEGYSRVQVERSTAQWKVEGTRVTSVKPISFPACTGGVGCITHAHVLNANGERLYAFELDRGIYVADGVTPCLSSLSIEF